MQAINRLHQAFARNLTHSLGAYLHIQFAAALVSGEHLSFEEFLQSIPEVTYLASCKLAPVGASALVRLDLAVAFPLIDVLLGGEGKGDAPARYYRDRGADSGDRDAHCLPRAANRVAGRRPTAVGNGSGPNLVGGSARLAGFGGGNALPPSDGVATEFRVGSGTASGPGKGAR